MRDDPSGLTGSAGSPIQARRSRWPLALSFLLHAAVLATVVHQEGGWAGARGGRGPRPIDVLFLPAAPAAPSASVANDASGAGAPDAPLTPAKRQAERDRRAMLDRLVQPTAIPDTDPGAVNPAAAATAASGGAVAGGDDGSVTRPEVVESSRVLPDYPEAAQRAGVEGVVVLRATIDQQGRLRGLRVLRGVDPLLDEAALAAVRRWKFRPATRNGKPVQVDYVLTLDFHL